MRRSKTFLTVCILTSLDWNLIISFFNLNPATSISSLSTLFYRFHHKLFYMTSSYTQMTSSLVKIRPSLCFKFFNIFFFHTGQSSNNCTGIFFELFGNNFLVLPRFHNSCPNHGLGWSGLHPD